jgi:hypothetical protein
MPKGVYDHTNNRHGSGWKIKDTSKMMGKHPHSEFKKGFTPWNKGLLGYGTFNKGKKRTEEMNEKQSLIRRGMFAKEKNPNWKGGKGTERHAKMGQYDYILWRSIVFERDRYTCQDCGAKGVFLMAHHIKSWALNPRLRYELSNGITYCKRCHAKNDKHYAKFYREAVFVS